jgi:hypothetical protein
VIDLRAEEENASDSMHFHRESLSNEIDESDSQFKRHDEQRDSAFREIMIDVIGCLSKEPRPMFATRRVAAREGKKADDGTMTSSPDPSPTIVAGHSATQTLIPAMTTSVSDILMKKKRN